MPIDFNNDTSLVIQGHNSVCFSLEARHFRHVPNDSRANKSGFAAENAAANISPGLILPHLQPPAGHAQQEKSRS